MGYIDRFFRDAICIVDRTPPYETLTYSPPKKQQEEKKKKRTRKRRPTYQANGRLDPRGYDWNKPIADQVKRKPEGDKLEESTLEKKVNHSQKSTDVVKIYFPQESKNSYKAHVA